MVKPRETAKDPPPAESEEEESEEDESESEPEDAGNGNSTPPPSAGKKPESLTSKELIPATGAASSSGEEDEETGSESESGSDEDTPPRKSDFSIKPIASKPMTEPEKSTATAAGKRASFKPNASSPTSPTRNATTGGAGAKRAAMQAGTPAGTADSKRAKRKTPVNLDKKVGGTPNVDEEKKLFARVFSEDDEIVLLKGMVDFTAKTKSDPIAKINEFHEFITKKMGGDKTKAQVLHKMRRLKKRYENHADKVLKSGKERNLSNPHDRNMYELFKKIWGSEETAGEEEPSEGVPKGNKKTVEANGSEARMSQSSKVVNERAEEEVKIESQANVKKRKSFSFAPDDGRFNADWFLHEGIELMEEDDKIEMENKWKEFRLEEAELLIKKHTLMLEHMGKVRKSIKSFEN